MADRVVSTESVRAIAGLLGIERDEAQIEELAEQVRMLTKATATLDSLDLTPYEPAITLSVGSD